MNLTNVMPLFYWRTTIIMEFKVTYVDVKPTIQSLHSVKLLTSLTCGKFEKTKIHKSMDEVIGHMCNLEG
jgi:hypothetical protein